MEKEGEEMQGGACGMGLKGGERRSARIVRTQNRFLFPENPMSCQMKIIIFPLGLFFILFLKIEIT